ncbi:MAG: hypothetical protein ACI9KE_005125 [Polyangiales bacterium]|jgi:hypothetical protein
MSERRIGDGPRADLGVTCMGREALVGCDRAGVFDMSEVCAPRKIRRSFTGFEILQASLFKGHVVTPKMPLEIVLRAARAAVAADPLDVAETDRFDAVASASAVVTLCAEARVKAPIRRCRALLSTATPGPGAGLLALAGHGEGLKNWSRAGEAESEHES